MRLKVHDWMSAEKVNLGDGIVVPARLLFEWSDDGTLGDIDLNVRIEATIDAGRYVVSKLTVEAPSVTAALLRKIPVRDILRDAVLMAALRRQQTPTGTAYKEIRFDPTVAERGPTPEALKALATIYRLAYAVGDNPTKAVAAELNLAGSTAGRWVMKARSAGYLGATQPGKAGA